MSRARQTPALRATALERGFKNARGEVTFGKSGKHTASPRWSGVARRAGVCRGENPYATQHRGAACRVSGPWSVVRGLSNLRTGHDAVYEVDFLLLGGGAARAAGVGHDGRAPDRDTEGDAGVVEDRVTRAATAAVDPRFVGGG